MKFKKLESGRSMVEMLGVLAIIGVLSVGGIAGYSLAMRRHRANGVADLASKYALVLYNFCQQKLINGDIPSFGLCSQIPNPSFAEADIGSLPAGVTAIGTKQGVSPAYDHDPATGVDIVIISAYFDDDKLCQAVGSISGGSCYKEQNFSVSGFKIKQN